MRGIKIDTCVRELISLTCSQAFGLRNSRMDKSLHVSVVKVKVKEVKI
jgi:hypothetical protein